MHKVVHIHRRSEREEGVRTMPELKQNQQGRHKHDQRAPGGVPDDVENTLLRTHLEPDQQRDQEQGNQVSADGQAKYQERTYFAAPAPKERSTEFQDIEP